MSRKKVLLVGASSGIGAATARRFADDGWNVAATARREPMLQALIGAFPPGDHWWLAGDYSDAKIALRLQETITARWGHLDALVNCAGISKAVPVVDSDFAEWKEIFEIMVNGAAYMSRMAAARMPEGGRIIHVTSIHARRAERNSSAYGMAKAAIEQLCRSLALELADRKILVNAIAPGFVDTPMSAASGVNELEGDWFSQNYVRGHHLPLRRAGRPEEIAGVASFLAGADATYITGQTITVDGGLSITF